MKVPRLVVAALLVASVAACGGDDRSGNAFCSELEVQMPKLTATMLDQTEVKALVAAYRAVGKHAPVAVRDDWNAITELMDEASKLDARDKKSVQVLADLAYATKLPAERARKYAREKCGIELMTGLDTVVSTTSSAPAKTGE